MCLFCVTICRLCIYEFYRYGKFCCTVCSKINIDDEFVVVFCFIEGKIMQSQSNQYAYLAR